MDKSRNVKTLSGKVDDSETNVADLDQALAVVGLGTYNLKYCLVLALFLIAAIVEPVGYSFLLPASQCDLEMSLAMRGFISSIPYIGIVLTSFPWGYLVDTRGRKRMIIISSLAAGVLGIAAGFMPELISFTICKFLASLWGPRLYNTANKFLSILKLPKLECKSKVTDWLGKLDYDQTEQLLSVLNIACPAAVPYTFIGEIIPLKYRDITLSVTNSMQIMGSALVPLYAWAILPSEFSADFGMYNFRGWRLLCMVYSCMYVIAAALLSCGPESPKYLVSQGKHDEALEVLRTMYAANKGTQPENFPIKALKMPVNNQNNKVSFLSSLKVQSAPLLRPPYLKWLFLNGFLLFGIFNVLNGLIMWIPDVLNRVLSGESSDLTACGIIALGRNTTSAEDVCVDTIEPITFAINSIASVACAVIALIVSTSVKFIGKKILLILILLLIGVFIIVINVTTQSLVFAVLLSSMPLAGLAIGPVNAYSVEIFPTNLRGMAVSLTMMMGRTGSIAGANVAGAMINVACEAMFYMFGGLLILCSALSFLLPKSAAMPPVKKNEAITRL